MLSLYGLIKEELIKQDKLPDKYKDIVYSTESYCINPDGCLNYSEVEGSTSNVHETVDGWKFYKVNNPDCAITLDEQCRFLSSESDPSWPRAQSFYPGKYIAFKTPQKGILTSYVTTQFADSSNGGRVCNDWEIIGYNSEQDLLNLTNGTVLSHDGWDKFYSNGKSKTVQIAEQKPFQYYAVHLINNFYNGAPESSSSPISWCSMGATKFYMRMPVAKCINNDGIITAESGGNGWKIYDKSEAYGEVWCMLNSSANPQYPRWQAGVFNVNLPADDYNYYAYLKTPEKCKISSYLTTIVYDRSSSAPARFRGRVCSHWQLVGYATEEDMLNLRNGYMLSENYWFATPVAGNTKRVFIKNNKKFQYYTLRMLKKYAGNSYVDAAKYNVCCMGATKFYTN